MSGPKTPIRVAISDKIRIQLTKITKSYTTVHAMVVRSTIILLLSAGINISEVSRQTNTSRQIVRKWAIRYNASGIKGLQDEERTGRPPEIDPEVVLHIIKIACEMPDSRGRSLAKWDCQEIVTADFARHVRKNRTKSDTPDFVTISKPHPA